MEEKVGLTDLQKAVLSKRLDLIREDFGVVALRVLCADGSEWKVGEFPAPPEKKHTRISKKEMWEKTSYVPGTLKKACEPWVKLAYENPNQDLKVRLSDFPEGLSLDRISGSLSSYMVRYAGAGNYRIIRVRDEAEGLAFVIRYMPQGTGLVRGSRGLPYNGHNKEENGNEQGQGK